MRRGFLMFLLALPLAVRAGELLAAERWVSGRGADLGNDCLTLQTPCKSVEHALATAAAGDTVNVAAGTYKVRLELRGSVDLTLRGGWDSDFTKRDPALTPSILAARKITVSSQFGMAKDARVLVAIAESGDSIALLIDGFVLTRGKAAARSPFLLDYSAPFPLSQDGGGGIYGLATGGTIVMTVRECVITRNRSKIVAGGGVFVGASRGGTADVTFERTTITENRVAYGGGIELVSSQQFAEAPAVVHVRVVNSTVANNRAEGSAAIFALQNGGQAVLDLVNSTVTGNAAREDSDEEVEGAIVLNHATANITNTILWGNVVSPPAAGADLDVGQAAVANVDHSDVGEFIEVSGGTFNDVGANLSVDPLLRGFALTPASPLIDAGTCAGAPAEDFDGDARPSGVACDIGADEFVP
jgi:hypothetical protein